MVEALPSDIDGTLVDSNALHAEAWRRAFEHFGIQVGIDEAWSQIDKGGDKLIPVFVKGGDRERLEKEIAEFRRDIFHRDYMPRIRFRLSQGSTDLVLKFRTGRLIRAGAPLLVT